MNPTESQIELPLTQHEPMTDDEFRVWTILSMHLGRWNAVSSRAIEEATDLPGSAIREIVASLIENHGKLIGSFSGNPAGYWIVRNMSEFELSVRHLRSRATKLNRRIRAMERNLKVSPIHWQGRLDLAQEEAGVRDGA